MKRLLPLFSLVLLVSFTATFAQGLVSLNPVKQNLNKPQLLTSILPNNGGTSGNSRAPQGTQRYVRTVYIISAAEMAAAGAKNGIKFYSLGFNYNAGQNVATTGTIKMYLENTAEAAFGKTNLTWTNGTDGVIDKMTLVHDGSITLPTTEGPLDISLSNGNAFTYTGGALYVAFDYQNPSGTIATTGNVALCNNTSVGGANGLRNAYSTTAAPTAMQYTSAFRPETRAGWSSGIATDAGVNMVQSFGKIPVLLGANSVIAAQVQNYGDNALTNVSVTLSITGANTFTNTKVIASLPRDAAALVTFDGFSPTVLGNNTVTVSVAADGNNANNSVSELLVTTSGSYSYADTSASSSALGFSTGAGMMFTKYHITGATTVNSVTVTIGNSTGNPGNTVYGICADATGKILAKSADYKIGIADLDKPITFNFPAPVSVKDQDIYVGIAQTANAAAGYYPLATQDEDPGRSGAYYVISGLTGTAFEEANTYGCFMIQADLAAAVVPVELSAFTSSVKDGIVTLNWSTATETNNSGFQVERKTVNTNEWSVAGFVKGNSTTSEVSSYTFSDNVAKFGAAVYNYRLKQIDFDGTAKYYNLSQNVEITAPKSFTLEQNFPNPFNPTTSISFSLPTESKVSLEVYDVLGKVVRTLVNENRAAGSYTVTFDASNLSSGVYFYRLTAGENTLLKKMNLMK